jgi:hypothetical protein
MESGNAPYTTYGDSIRDLFLMRIIYSIACERRSFECVTTLRLFNMYAISDKSDVYPIR